MKKIILFSFFSFLLSFNSSGWAKESHQEFSLPPLPYKESALEPYISQKTLSFHYGKHHKDYVMKTNKLAKENGLTGLSLEEVIQKSAKDPTLKTLFNNAAQVWNHTFYWSSMKAHGGGHPQGPLLETIKKDFGSYEQFKKQFIETGSKLFGSGWVWLVSDKDHKLKILGTKDADLPLIHGEKPLLACDIWEHAYYLDYQNRRKDYVEVFLDHLVNWEFATHNYRGGENEHHHRTR